MTIIPKYILTPVLLFLSLIHIAAYADQETTVYDGPVERLHIYLLIGQSNMSGQATFWEEDAITIPGAYLLNNDNVFEPAMNPFNRYSTIRKGLLMQNMNPGYTFSREMLEKTDGISIGMVVNARGGTSIEQWKKGSHYYDEAVTRANVARKVGLLKGVLWHQGEANSRQPEGYLNKLKKLILNLRRDLGEPDLPFVAGQLFYDREKKPHTKQINEEIARLPTTVPYTGYTRSDGLTTFDNTHFDARGMKLLGKRYAEEILRLQQARDLFGKCGSCMTDSNCVQIPACENTN